MISYISIVSHFNVLFFAVFFFFSSRRRHTRYIGDWSSDVCSSDLRPGQGHDLEVEGGEVAVGSFLAEGRDRHDDEAGIPPTQDVVLEPPAAQRPRRRSEERRVGKECRSRRVPKLTSKDTETDVGGQ